MDRTNWIFLALAVVVVAGFFVMQRLRLISASHARALLRQGAKVIDVRSPLEFQTHHIPNVVNLPLDELETRIAREAPDKDAALLLHCQSGARSGFAERTLKQLGYTRVFNLGSLARARSILGSADQPQ